VKRYGVPELTFGFTPATPRPYDAALPRGVDGDTINIDQSVRMVSIDTPDSKVGGSPPVAQATLDRCRQRLVDGVYNETDEGLRAASAGPASDASPRRRGCLRDPVPV
jgi:endonuclease YncB( thermonuclease family)